MRLKKIHKEHFQLQRLILMITIILHKNIHTEKMYLSLMILKNSNLKELVCLHIEEPLSSYNCYAKIIMKIINIS